MSPGAASVAVRSIPSCAFALVVVAARVVPEYVAALAPAPTIRLANDRPDRVSNDALRPPCVFQPTAPEPGPNAVPLPGFEPGFPP
jgi:hypothetical protein